MEQNKIIIPDDITKIDIMRFIDEITDLVNRGDAEALPIYIRAKAMIKAMEGIVDNLEYQAMNEADRFKEKTFVLKSAQITKKDGADLPEYKEDDQYMILKGQIKDREELLKMAYKLKDKTSCVDPLTGELVPVLPARKSKSSLTIQFI